MIRVAGLLVALLFVAPVLFFSAPEARQAQVPVYTCPMHPEIVSSTGGFCPKCEMQLVVQQPKKDEEEEAADAYTCPMHPEVRTAAPGICPKCKMTLVATLPGIPEEFDLQMDLTPNAPKAGEALRMRFRIFNPRTGEPAKQFALLHDRFFHLFVISQDMTEFQHIHPKFEADGSFTIETQLPKPGRYSIYADFYPVDGTPQVLQRSVATAGFRTDLVAGLPRLDADRTFVKTVTPVKIARADADKVGVDFDALPKEPVNPVKIELKREPEELIAGQEVTLKFVLTDARTGEPVRDLLPYLSAWGHTLILSEDQSDYVHSHPEEEVPTVDDATKLRGGPEVTFNALFPRPGRYRIWTQFLRGDSLANVVFTVEVNRLQRAE